MELIDKQAKKLEKQMNLFQLLLPERPPKSVRTTANTEAFEDKYIASTFLSLLQENMTQHLRFIRTSLTNDDVRKMFTEFLKDEVDLYDSALKYIKLIFLIGLQQTLEKQVNLLEKESNNFGLPLTSQPPKSVNTMEGKDLYNDESMYRDVFTGMQYMFELHATALRQSVTNDRLRKIYIKLLHDEISTLDTWVKYGKTKGWLRPTQFFNCPLKVVLPRLGVN